MEAQKMKGLLMISIIGRASMLMYHAPALRHDMDPNKDQISKYTVYVVGY